MELRQPRYSSRIVERDPWARAALDLDMVQVGP